jgi:hypothetical protein
MNLQMIKHQNIENQLPDASTANRMVLATGRKLGQGCGK